MGNWVITIEGTGQHHNQGSPTDADVIADEMVQRLLNAGQNVERASFTSGGRMVLPTNRREPAAR